MTVFIVAIILLIATAVVILLIVSRISSNSNDRQKHSSLASVQKDEVINLELIYLNQRQQQPHPCRKTLKEISCNRHRFIPAARIHVSSKLSGLFSILSHHPTNSKVQYMDSFEEKVNIIKKLIETDKYRRRVLRACNQDEPKSFEEYSTSGIFKKIERFESSTYSEVLKATNSKDNQTVVMKIIRAISKQVIKKVPYMASNGCQSYNDIMNEIVITQALSDLHRGVIVNDLMYKTQFFCRIYEIKVLTGDMERSVTSSSKVQDGGQAGSTPQSDEDEKKKRGKKMEEEKKLSEEDRMLIEILPKEYVVSVMKHDGHPLWWMMNHGKLNEFQMASVLIQVVVGLAIAEKVYKYEHRDLHISNILIKPTSKKTLPYVSDGVQYNIDTFGIKSTIIDATFSRLSRDGRVYYRDLKSTLRSYAGNKPAIKMSLQNRAYRQMVTTTENNWSNYTPKSNLIWLTYLCETMLKSEQMKSNKLMQKEIAKLRDYTLKAKNTGDLLAKMPVLRSPVVVTDITPTTNNGATVDTDKNNVV